MEGRNSKPENPEEFGRDLSPEDVAELQHRVRSVDLKPVNIKKFLKPNLSSEVEIASELADIEENDGRED